MKNLSLPLLFSVKVIRPRTEEARVFWIILLELLLGGTATAGGTVVAIASSTMHYSMIMWKSASPVPEVANIGLLLFCKSMNQSRSIGYRVFFAEKISLVIKRGKGDLGALQHLHDPWLEECSIVGYVVILLSLSGWLSSSRVPFSTLAKKCSMLGWKERLLFI